MPSTTKPEVMGPSRLVFTAPWEPVVVRRGDALGLRALADQFADAVAPGLSNRVRDGRWVTILAWCLARSHEVFFASRGRSVRTRSEQSQRYRWLRPLELMWVARTIALAKDDWKDRSLAGQRRVRPWYEDDERYTDRFGMSVDQFRAYRQTGMYGGYRIAFRKWPAMTVGGDGWTPDRAASRLAKWLDGKLGGARPSWPLHQAEEHAGSLLARVPRLGSGEEHDWWLRHWPGFDKGGRTADANTLPRRKTDFQPLPERELLAPVIFGSHDAGGKRRNMIAREVANSEAVDHAAVCEHLGHVLGREPAIALLPRFSHLADAGIAAMEVVSKALGDSSRVALSEVAGRDGAVEACEALRAAAAAWLCETRMQVRHVETADRFAAAVPSARPVECLRALLEHHESHGGGLRWFVLRQGHVEARTLPGAGSSRYRFRLWSLCRLAAQCEVLPRMPTALVVDGTDVDPAAEGSRE